jgi:sulfur carrier protein
MSEPATAEIEVNGKRGPLAAATLAELLDQKGIDAKGRGVAIAVNGSVVTRSTWATTALRPNDVVEIVQAKQGG